MRLTPVATEDARVIQGQLEAREADRRSNAAQTTLGNIARVARHSWSGFVTAPASFAYQDLSSFTQSRNDGLVGLSGGEFTLLQPGKWSMDFTVHSDSAAAGAFAMRATWMPDGILSPFGVTIPIEVGGYRGSGFTSAGYRADQLTWTGYADPNDIATPIQLSIYGVSVEGFATDASYAVSFTYLGGNT